MATNGLAFWGFALDYSLHCDVYGVFFSQRIFSNMNYTELQSESISYFHLPALDSILW